MKTFLAALALLATLPLTAQQDEQPFFSVSSARVWTTRDKPSVQISSWQVEALEFRLYRLNDPVKFFSELKDLHQFGGLEQKPPKPLTPLERFHNWKNEWRYQYRSLVREQFTPETHTQISKALDRQREAQATRRITNFTPLPLLNPQQVVSVWKQYMPKRGGWSYEPIRFDNPGKGVYLLEAADKDLRAYTVVMVSDLAMITKQAPGRFVAYLADRQSGAPVAGAALSVIAAQTAVARADSDANGIASTPLVIANPENLVILAKHQNDWAIASPYGFNFGQQQASRWHGYIYTDRPVYRPGHPVNFKGIFRREQGLLYVPATGTVDLSVQAPDGNTVFEKKAVPLSQMGTAWGGFTLRPDAALGYYSVIAKAPNVNPMSGGFQVEEYKKPEYDVRVTLQKQRVLQGDSIQGSIDARYYFGEPVANAKVTWVAHRAPWFTPVFWRDQDEGEMGYQPADDNNDPGDRGGAELEEQTGKLDANGHLDITVPTTRGKTDFVYSIEARVTDQGNREIAGHAFATATRGSFALNVEPDKYGYAVGQQATFRLQARDYDGQPIATKMKLELIEWNWRDPKALKTLSSTEGVTDAATGDGHVAMTIPNAKSLLARVTARTPEGRDVTADTYLWIFTGHFDNLSSGQDIQIFPDQKTYKPGDTAKLMITSAKKMDHVFLTVEGRNIDVPQVLHPGANSFTIDVPVKAEYQPNFYVSAAAFIDGEMHQGSKSLSVPATDRQIHVEIQPAKDQYKPGESAQYNVTTKDVNGKPVAAELSLGVVDEAIYAIQPDQTPDMAGFFYGHLYNFVNTDTSLAYFFSGAAGTRRMMLSQLRPPTALAQLKPERLVQPQIRKAFLDTAYWLPNLTTDAGGHGTARFAFPDSLTTWRATARAITADTRVGSATQKTIVRKNLMVRLAVPRFFTQGDEVVISAIVHNYLQTTKTARVSLDLQGLDVLTGAQQDVTIPSRGEAKLDWRVRPKDIASVVITAKALTDEESDAMELTLPVNPRGVKEALSRSGVLTTDAGDFTLQYPAASAAFGRKLSLSVTPSIAGSLFSALEYLTSFPYGCTEQTMSSFVPNLIVADALRNLKIKSAVDPVDLNVKVRAGLTRLYEYQHPDGGWGWWPTDDSGVFMTAYVVAGLNQAQDLGQKIKAGTLPRAVKWLRAALAKSTDADPDLRAYAAWAMRENLEPVYQDRAKLSPYGLALLGLALDAKNDARAQAIAADLEAKAAQDADSAHWILNHDSLMGFYTDASPEATAFAVKLLAHRIPQSPLLPKAARWLLAHRNQGFWWSSTKQTAMVVYGLTDYLKQSGELDADFNATVTVNGRPVLTKHFTGADPEELTLPGVDLTQNVRITRTGKGRLYWSARAEYYSTDKKSIDNGTVKLNVIREYFRLVQGKKDERIVYDLQPLNGPLKVGDLLGVRLTVTGTQWKYTIAEDPIPAGAEFVTRDDLYELRDPKSWWTNYYSRREFHDDRAAFFNQYFPSGQRQYFYLLKITNPGQFHVNPARAWPMYEPDKLTTTAPAEVTVQ